MATNPINTDANAWPTLHKQQFINLFTYRKDGSAVKTPVWFAQQGEKLYITTTRNAAKVRRVRNNSRVLLGPADRAGNPLGPTIDAQARVLSAEEAPIAKAALDAKYGLFKAAFDFFITLRGVERDYIEVTPLPA